MADNPLSPSTLALRLGALLLWAAALVYLSLAPNVTVPSAAFGWDKLNHAAAYAVLAGLLILTLLARQAASTRLLAGAWAACFAYGLLLEGLQELMGLGRTFEWGDLLANGLGALATCVVFCLIAGRSSQANVQRSP